MKLRREMIDYIARQLIVQLQEKKFIEIENETENVIAGIVSVIIDDLSVEDQLNDEVKDMLDKMGDEVDNVDYRKMFQMVKSKLARDRGLIL